MVFFTFLGMSGFALIRALFGKFVFIRVTFFMLRSRQSFITTSFYLFCHRFQNPRIASDSDVFRIAAFSCRNFHTIRMQSAEPWRSGFASGLWDSLFCCWLQAALRVLFVPSFVRLRPVRVPGWKTIRRSKTKIGLNVYRGRINPC